jgi:hypothetical protein
MKMVFKCCWLLTLLFYSCSTTKSSYEEESIPFENEFAKATIEKSTDLTFENINYGWQKFDQGTQHYTTKAVTQTNSPTPFSPSTDIKWIVTEQDSFNISLFDLKGNKINSLFTGYLSKGLYEMNFTESNLNSSVYLIIMDVGKEKYFRKFMFLK